MGLAKADFLNSMHSKQRGMPGIFPEHCCYVCGLDGLQSHHQGFAGGGSWTFRSQAADEPENVA